MTKFIGHYKSVNSPEEFYSAPRQQLDFPTQVRRKSKNYLLFSTIQVSTSKQEKSILSIAKARSIDTGVEV
jgi:hypothetical protein